MTIGGTSLTAQAQGAIGVLKSAMDTQASLVGQLINGGVQNTESMIHAAAAETGKGTRLDITV